MVQGGTARGKGDGSGGTAQPLAQQSGLKILWGQWGAVEMDCTLADFSEFMLNLGR